MPRPLGDLSPPDSDLSGHLIDLSRTLTDLSGHLADLSLQKDRTV